MGKVGLGTEPSLGGMYGSASGRRREESGGEVRLASGTSLAFGGHVGHAFRELAQGELQARVRPVTLMLCGCFLGMTYSMVSVFRILVTWEPGCYNLGSASSCVMLMY